MATDVELGCAGCGAPGSAFCDVCAVRAGGPVFWVRVEADPDGEPTVVMGDRRIPWAVFGLTIGGSSLTVGLAPTEEVLLEDVTIVSTGPLVPVRDPIDETEAEAWQEAIGLLAECLPPLDPCPDDDLAAACRAARAGVASGSEPWPSIAEAAGWPAGRTPADDEDLWTGAAMALVSVAVPSINGEAARCLDLMDLDDWLATVLELLRSGTGTPADPESLVALSARCFDVDSGALDPDQASVMLGAFGAIVPVWVALGAVDADGLLTKLGAWGIPHSLARAWGGSL